jgi:hypothetical protein
LFHWFAWPIAFRDNEMHEMMGIFIRLHDRPCFVMLCYHAISSVLLWCDLTWCDLNETDMMWIEAKWQGKGIECHAMECNTIQ